jgi:hypothetical protein
VGATVFALAAFGAGHVWARQPYQAELASSRFRVEVLDILGAWILKMTPAERQQFDALMRLDVAPKR